MTDSIPTAPTPRNEPVKDYAPGSPERASLRSRMDEMAAERIEIPMVIGGRNITTGDRHESVMPHATKQVLGDVHQGTAEHVGSAIEAAAGAHPEWANLPWQERAAVFLRAADLLAGPWRDTINASTMLGQSKTVHQAEIDAACELIDFWRFNVAFAERIYAEQPGSAPGMWNQLDYRSLEGFVLAVTPFNFTSIAGNLPTAPALMGNTVVWKPANTQAFSAHYLMELFQAAGLPDGVINLVQGPGPVIGEVATSHPDLAGIHFTGSTTTFEWMWRKVGERVSEYRNFPRLVGETGGKDFILAHPSASVDALTTALIRGAFEYQGQKCSAASRIYVPSNLWPALRQRIADEVAQIRMGDVADFTNFMGAVIDGQAFRTHKEALDEARTSDDLEVIAGGSADDSVGYFIDPTVVRSDDPKHRLMTEELFGPIVTVYVYPEKDFEQTLELVDTSTPFALTGAIFAEDTYAIERAKTRLRWAAGNFYVNDKPTGAVVGQQPFGGARRSGTNDKAGSMWNLMRWASPRTIKETFAPPVDYRYPFLAPDEDDRP